MIRIKSPPKPEQQELYRGALIIPRWPKWQFSNRHCFPQIFKKKQFLNLNSRHHLFSDFRKNSGEMASWKLKIRLEKNYPEHSFSVLVFWTPKFFWMTMNKFYSAILFPFLEILFSSFFFLFFCFPSSFFVSSP